MTSTTQRRRWQTARGWRHHLIDPSTGQPAEGDVVAVTVVAGEAAGAEALAKAALVARTVEGAAELLAGHGVAAVVVPRLGPVVPVGRFVDLCWTFGGGDR